MTEEIKEPTAFYREIGMRKLEERKLDFPTKEVYDAVYKAMLPYLFERQMQPRHLGGVLLLFVFDVVTTAMAITKYDEEIDGKSLTFEDDMTGFIEQLMIMINAMPDATGANARLLIDRKSIFNVKEKFDS